MQDERSGLFREYLRLVEGLLPKFIIIENVPGMSSIEDGTAIKEIKSGLTALGYKVEVQILKAEEYGVPQERRRLIFIGNRLNVPICFPKPTHGKGKQPFITVWDAISDLPPLENGQGTEIIDYIIPPLTQYQRNIRAGAIKLYSHVAPTLGQVNIERMKYVPEGGSWRDIPVDLLPAGMKRARRSDHTKRYGRLRRMGLLQQF